MEELITRKCIKCGLTFKFNVEKGSEYLLKVEEDFICKDCFVDCL